MVGDECPECIGAAGRKRMADPTQSPFVSDHGAARASGDRQRALDSTSGWKLQQRNIPADVRPAVGLQAVRKRVRRSARTVFRRLPWPWCERLIEWWDLEK